MDRKDFFGKALRMIIGKGLDHLATNPVVIALEKFADGVVPSIQLKKQRPPGSAPETQFKQICTGCDACMIACPINVIMIEDLEKRTPLIYPDKGPCIHCQNYPCISVCPTGALHLTYGTDLRFLNDA